MNRLLLILVLCGLLAHGAIARSAWLTDLGLQNTEVNKDIERQEWMAEYTVDDVQDSSFTGESSWTGSVGSFFRWAAGKITKLVFGETVPSEARPQPRYIELCNPKKSFNYEARQYSRSVWVSVSLVSKFPDLAVLEARPKLMAYFEGGNDQNVTMNFSEPLRLRLPTPTGQWGPDIKNKTLIYSMYLPKEFQDDPPAPTDPDLHVTVEAPSEFFVIKFPGYTFDFMNFQMLGRLKDRLNEKEERFDRGLYYVNVYNTTTEVFNRTNEVMLAFNPMVKKPRCAGTKDQQSIEQLYAEMQQQMVPGSNATNGQPSYRQLCPLGEDYEARQYQRAVWVSTTVRSVSSDIGAFLAYPKLMKYFDGGNDQGLKIESTLPARVTQAWPKSVYDPVIYTNYTYSYYLPANLYGNIPQPLDDDVVIADEAASVRFARRFAGYTYDFMNKQELNVLENALIKSGEQFLSFKPWATNQYYFSSQLQDRLNDITVPMDPLVKRPVCSGQTEFPPCLHRDKECPSYRILKNLTDDIQVRHVSRNRYAMQRTRTCDMNAAYSKAYMPLHRYFRGNNSLNLEIQRLPPVVLVHKSTTNPPPGCDFTYNLMFYMPASLHHDPPTPTEDDVELIWLETKETFVLSFEESADEAVVAAKVGRLRAELDNRGYCYTEDEFALASFDSPYRPLPHHREIWISSSKCAEPFSEPGPEYSLTVSNCPEGSVCPMYETANEYPAFSERIYDRLDWICKETTSCDVVSALESSIAPLQEYIKKSYKNPPKSRPVTSFLSVPDFVSTGCDKKIKTCMYMPQTARQIKAPTQGLNLETNLWQVAYVASADGAPTSSNIEGSMTQLLQSILDSDLFHSGQVFVGWYDLPADGSQEALVEVGALTDTLSYKV